MNCSAGGLLALTGTDTRNAAKEGLAMQTTQQAPHPYMTIMDVLCRPLELIREKDVADGVTHPWWNQTLCEVNDSVVRLGVVKGEYHWHKHDNDDEFFYVVEGRLLIDLDDRTIDLPPRNGVVIPKGVMHRPRAPERTVMLMVETKAIVPTGS